jgi:hypothetical protein
METTEFLVRDTLDYLSADPEFCQLEPDDDPCCLSEEKSLTIYQSLCDAGETIDWGVADLALHVCTSFRREGDSGRIEPLRRLVSASSRSKYTADTLSKYAHVAEVFPSGKRPTAPHLTFRHFFTATFHPSHRTPDELIELAAETGMSAGDLEKTIMAERLESGLGADAVSPEGPQAERVLSQRGPLTLSDDGRTWVGQDDLFNLLSDLHLDGGEILVEVYAYPRPLGEQEADSGGGGLGADLHESW